MAYQIFRVTASIALVLLMPVASQAGEPEADDPWKPVRILLGTWVGNGSGLGGESTVRHSYEFVLDGKFIHSTTRSVFKPKEAGVAGEIHEDLGFFSFDSDRDKLVFRQFLSEGFVNTYVLDDLQMAPHLLFFTSESTEGAGGMAARLIITFDHKDAYRMILELASPGKDFFACQNMEMKRVTEE